MPEYCITTDRIGLRAPVVRDVALLLDLESDPQVLRHVGNKPLMRERLQDEVMPRWLGYSTGESLLGYFIAEELDTSEFVGWYHLRPPRYDLMPEYSPTRGELEIGFRLKRKFWNKGYTTEVSRELLRIALELHGVSRVIAIADPDNGASLRVMEKVGLRESGTTKLISVGPVAVWAFDVAANLG